jgi:hypothetical protein
LDAEIAGLFLTMHLTCSVQEVGSMTICVDSQLAIPTQHGRRRTRSIIHTSPSDLEGNEEASDSSRRRKDCPQVVHRPSGHPSEDPRPSREQAPALVATGKSFDCERNVILTMVEA